MMQRLALQQQSTQAVVVVCGLVILLLRFGENRTPCYQTFARYECEGLGAGGQLQQGCIYTYARLRQHRKLMEWNISLLGSESEH